MAEQNVSASEHSREKLPWCMQQYVSPDERRRIAMQDENTQGGLQPI
jgi:hypothetical protein